MRNRYFVYIVTNYTRTTLYIGVTNDLERRIWEHKNKECEGFTEKYNCDCLVYFEETNDITTAIQREKNIKKWKREWKENIIKEMNPKWVDLANDWFDAQDPRDKPEDDKTCMNKKQFLLSSRTPE
jgi:putative endonuclease